MTTKPEVLPTFGRAGHLTPEQSAALEKFKEVLTAAKIFDGQNYDDHILLRFMRARKFDIEAATKMFTDYHNWRSEYGVDKLKDSLEFPEYPIVKKFYPRYYHKTDKLGRPVYVEVVGELDIKQLFAVTTTERIIQNHVYEYEKLVNYRMTACSKKAGVYLEQSCTILDLKGVSLSSFSSVYSTIKEFSAVAQNYYPEMLGKMFIINTPMLFTAVWSLVKPLLDEVTVSKIQILGYSYQSKLLEMIDAENLPETYGGKCKCEEFGGCREADIGPWNDQTVEGYPIKEYERFPIEFGHGQGSKVFKE